MVTPLIATFTNTLRHHQDACKHTRFSLQKLCATAVTSNDNFEKQLLEFSETEQISIFLFSYAKRCPRRLGRDPLMGGEGEGDNSGSEDHDTGAYNRNRGFHFFRETPTWLDSHEGKISMTEKFPSLRLLVQSRPQNTDS
ncbi:hypothetical protein RRG08_038466 [Elysia crispata]|uniref:Uncharacterized protein n=1 Tax=Elysia crispata TaxID=231223 RepID=A0AAE0YXT8_9GAST|nr:hypothetical protein RRG08_038466 [Elysia crispata]